MKQLPNNLFFEETERILSSGENVELRIKGGSMRPYLRSGKDIVVLSPFELSELKPGAIVLFRYHNKHLLHRIVKIKDKRLIIQGDGNYQQYEEAFSTDVVGLVRKVIRPNGTQISTQHFCSRLYWHCWYFLHPLRRYLLAIYNRL